VKSDFRPVAIMEFPSFEHHKTEARPFVVLGGNSEDFSLVEMGSKS
jgi:hypothetical protein